MKKNHLMDAGIGGKVREARLAAKMSQGVLAEHLGISFQQVQKYELGKDRVSASTLYAISCLYKLPVAFFYGSVDLGEALGEAEAGAEIGSGSINTRILKVWSAIGDEQVKKQLYRLMETLLPEPAAAKPPVEKRPVDASSNPVSPSAPASARAQARLAEAA